ncbi:MAG: hypothetical protein JSS14_22125 [Proteobacteria bacterium]|nr:hypothetical protein [Pseudomonadota bacterium]
MTIIQNKAMLVDLSISMWTATKHDKTVSAEVERAHGAKDAGRYNKALIDKSYLEPISKIANAARQYHYSRTLPWTDKGQRLLPSILFTDYSAELRKLKAEFSKAVDAFLQVYPDLRDKARTRLGTMFNPEDYPQGWELRDKFAIDTEIFPVPDAQDFRVDLANEQRDEIQASITKAVTSRQAKAVKDCYQRVREVVARISEQCGKEKGRIHDSLMDNARDLCGVLSGLNITDDPDIKQLERDIATMLVDPQALRDSPVERKKAADAADEILKKLGVL